jgi:hypothetical protein
MISVLPNFCWTSSLPYLSLGELWKTPTKSSSLYQHPDGKRQKVTENHQANKSFCKVGPAWVLTSTHRYYRCKDASLYSLQPAQRLSMGLLPPAVSIPDRHGNIVYSLTSAGPASHVLREKLHQN